VSGPTQRMTEEKIDTRFKPNWCRFAAKYRARSEHRTNRNMNPIKHQSEVEEGDLIMSQKKKSRFDLLKMKQARVKERFGSPHMTTGRHLSLNKPAWT
jgi:hypothetical protein